MEPLGDRAFRDVQHFGDFSDREISVCSFLSVTHADLSVVAATAAAAASKSQSIPLRIEVELTVSVPTVTGLEAIQVVRTKDCERERDVRRKCIEAVSCRPTFSRR